MSSAIRCVSCKQKINLAPNASGTVVCPMCKTSQPVPEEQGQYAPELSNPASKTSSSSNSQPGSTFTRDESERHKSQDMRDNPTPPRNDPFGSFGSANQAGVDNLGNKGSGCGCLLIGILLCVAVGPTIALVVG